MNFEMNRIKTPTGKIRHELRVWGFGPLRQEFRRRFVEKKDLLAELDRLQAEEEFLKSGRKLDSLTFGDLHDDFLKRRSGVFAPGWKKNIEGYWREFEADLSKLPPSAIGPDLLKSIETNLLKKGNSQRTANLKIGFIKAVMNFAIEMEVITENRAAKFRLQKPTDPTIEFWEREDAEDFLSFAAAKYPKGSEARWKYVVYVLGMNAGLRAGEIWALRPRCLKRSLGIMHIDEQFCRVAQTFRPPKGRGPRNVPLNQVLADELEEIIERRGISRHETIFEGEGGNPINHDNFKNRVFSAEFGDLKADKAAVVKGQLWGGPKIKFHGLRHTAATLMLGSGVDVKTVQEILGHKDLKTTMRYVHLLSANVKLAAEVFSVKPATVSRLKIVK